MTSQEFGELIRAKRESKRLTVEELARRLKLSPSTLYSIEDGSFENLPHVVYARGFARSYAKAVGVNASDLEAGMESLFPKHLFEEVPVPPAPLHEKTAKGGKNFADKLIALCIILVVIGIPVGGGWFVYVNYGRNIVEMVKKSFSAIAPSSQSPEEERSAVFRGANTPHALAANVPVVANLFPSPPPQAASPPIPPAAASSSGFTSQALAMPPAEQAAPASPVEGAFVSLQAKEECWVEVAVDGGGKRTFTIYPGETSVLPYKRKISLVLGNAGGVVVTHNNEPFPLTGKRNEKRTLTFP